MRPDQHDPALPAGELSRLPAASRTRLALMLTPVAAVLLVAGLLALGSASAPAGRVGGGLIAMLALLLLGVAQGLRRSVRLDERAAAERRLDAEIMATAGPCGGTGAGAADGTASSACGTGGCAGSAGDRAACGDCALRSLPRS